MTRSEQSDAPSAGWHHHEREQRRAWLALSYRERLRWLEQAKAFYALTRQSKKLPNDSGPPPKPAPR